MGATPRAFLVSFFLCGYTLTPTLSSLVARTPPPSLSGDGGSIPDRSRNAYAHVVFNKEHGLQILSRYERLYPQSPMFFVTKACLSLDEGMFCVLQTSSIDNNIKWDPVGLFVLLDKNEERAGGIEIRSITLEHCFWISPRCSHHLSLYCLREWIRTQGHSTLLTGDNLSLDDNNTFYMNRRILKGGEEGEGGEWGEEEEEE